LCFSFFRWNKTLFFSKKKKKSYFWCCFGTHNSLTSFRNRYQDNLNTNSFINLLRHLLRIKSSSQMWWWLSLTLSSRQIWRWNIDVVCGWKKGFKDEFSPPWEWKSSSKDELSFPLSIDWGTCSGATNCGYSSRWKSSCQQRRDENKVPLHSFPLKEKSQYDSKTVLLQLQ